MSTTNLHASKMPSTTERPEILAPERWERLGWMVESVARRYGVTVAGILAHKRTAILAAARHDLMVCLYGSGYGYAEIGRLLGRDHTGVMYAVRKELA